MAASSSSSFEAASKRRRKADESGDAWKEEVPRERMTRARAREREDAAKRSAAASAEFSVVVDEDLLSADEAGGAALGVAAGSGLPRGHHVMPLPTGIEDVRPAASKKTGAHHATNAEFTASTRAR